eukprot:sb/3466699/
MYTLLLPFLRLLTNGTEEATSTNIVFPFPEFTLQIGRGELVTENGTRNATGSIVINNSSLLCPPKKGGMYSKPVLDVICRGSGFEGAVSVRPHRMATTKQSLSCSTSEKLPNWLSLKVVCPENPTKPEDCIWGPMTHTGRDCNIDDTLVIRCSTERYQVIDVDLFANPDGALTGNVTTQRGSMVATVLDTRHNVEILSLVKIHLEGYHYQYLPTLACQYLGYEAYRSKAVPQGDQDYRRKLSCGYIKENGLKRMVEVKCLHDARSFESGCSWIVSEGERFGIEEATTVECGGRYNEEDEDEGEEEEDAEDEEEEFDYEDYYGDGELW